MASFDKYTNNWFVIQHGINNPIPIQIVLRITAESAASAIREI